MSKVLVLTDLQVYLLLNKLLHSCGHCIRSPKERNCRECEWKTLILELYEPKDQEEEEYLSRYDIDEPLPLYDIRKGMNERMKPK